MGTLALADIWFFPLPPSFVTCTSLLLSSLEVPVPRLRPFLGSRPQYFKHSPGFSGFLQAEQLLDFVSLLTVSSILS